MNSVTDGLLGTQFERGGRRVGGGIDCLGIVLELARRRGRALPDPWDLLRERYERGELGPGTGFPEGWSRVAWPPRNDDVVIFGQDRAGVGYVLDGYIWTASKSCGTYRLSIERLRAEVVEVWRGQA